MKLTPRQLNLFMFLKLPSAYLCGVRTAFIDARSCEVSVRHRWINQNPFKSMYWAVQGMAAEFSTGALITGKIKESGTRMSMLVTSNKATFTKKATGKITFTCQDGSLVDEALNKAIHGGEGETIWMTATGVNEAGLEVSTFKFEWSIKVKK
ncbi:DUF4442 domain-containing protein [Aestuariivivens sediminis]|uniref:DUF4442 domain-containing protein n=1 Tax=Aestuariivivens sediminis TaxID=2913557 RepID=UPI001F59C14B|nr:DUF4442 domain-containing protein [Aestuariivivens sediminis]